MTLKINNDSKSWKQNKCATVNKITTKPYRLQMCNSETKQKNIKGRHNQQLRIK